MYRERAFLLVITVLAGVLAGIAGSWLAWRGGARPPRAILLGAGSFSGAVALQLLILSFYYGTGC